MLKLWKFNIQASAASEVIEKARWLKPFNSAGTLPGFINFAFKNLRGLRLSLLHYGQMYLVLYFYLTDQV